MAGHSCSPSEAGTARASAATHESEEDEAPLGGSTVPAGQAAALAQAPEQAALARPAWSPKVPAGHSEQTAAPASA